MLYRGALGSELDPTEKTPDFARAEFTSVLPAIVEDRLADNDNRYGGDHAETAVLLVLTFAVVIAASGGLAVALPSGLPGSLQARLALSGLVGPNLVRVEIVASTDRTHDYWVHRGVVGKVHGNVLTLNEAGGAISQLPLSPATRIRLDGRRIALKRIPTGLRATLMRDGNAPASWLYLAKRLPDPSGR